MELEDRGGWRQRRQHYQTLSHSLRSGLNQLSFPLLLEDPQHYSSVLSSFRLAPGLAFEDLYTALKRSGFIIYAGQQGLNGLIFRLAVMGDLNQHDIERLILEFAAIYRQTNAETTDALKVMS
jgi:aspartate aminotransferase-like enzyme